MLLPPGVHANPNRGAKLFSWTLMSPREFPFWSATRICPVAKSKLLWRFNASVGGAVYS